MQSVGSRPLGSILFGDIPTVFLLLRWLLQRLLVIAPIISSCRSLWLRTLCASTHWIGHLWLLSFARWRRAVQARPHSSHEFPIAPVTAPPGIRRRSSLNIILVPLRISSPVEFFGLEAPDQAHSGSSIEIVSPRLCYPRDEHHDVVRHFVVGVLLHYLLGTHRLHQSHYIRRFIRENHTFTSHSAGPSSKSVDHRRLGIDWDACEVVLQGMRGVWAERQARIWLRDGIASLLEPGWLSDLYSFEDGEPYKKEFRQDSVGYVMMLEGDLGAALEAHQVNQNLELGNGNGNGNNNGNGNGNDNGNGNGNDNGNGNGNDNGNGNGNGNGNHDWWHGDKKLRTQCEWKRR
ncbi:hypothetical protein Tco_0821052 [Tanacetum coccineum]|uniref:Uncharacterized protein n=1 Tax=Tanacetum coccineum TaxID=301880 RepID=A0ABQ5AFD6_9ASTR